MLKQLLCKRLAIALGAIVLPGVVLAQNYHPLNIGFRWEYYSTAEGHQVMTISGELVVLGTTTRIRYQAEEIQLYENYWTSDAAGNLFLHGARNFTFPMDVAYLPPIQMVSAPLFAGKTWITYDIQLYSLDGIPWGDEPFDYPVRVYNEGYMQVPAGEFYAYGVGYDINPALIIRTANGAFDVFGRHLEEVVTGSDNSSEWYSVDVGLVQFGPYADPENDFRLLAYYPPPTPVLSTTWGAIKALFGPQ